MAIEASTPAPSPIEKNQITTSNTKGMAVVQTAASATRGATLLPFVLETEFANRQPKNVNNERKLHCNLQL